MISLEFSESGYSSALSNLQHLHSIGGRDSHISVRQGSMLDYFDVESEVIYLDTTYSTPLHLDQGILLTHLFSVLPQSLPGTFLIIISQINALSPSDYGPTPLIEIFRSMLSEHSSTYVYLFKVQ